MIDKNRLATQHDEENSFIIKRFKGDDDDEELLIYLDILIRMNLTKGKISRLYNKKRQSLKKINKKKKSSLKSTTFRRKRNVNKKQKDL